MDGQKSVRITEGYLLQRAAEVLQTYAGLFNEPAKRARLDRSVHWNDNRAVIASHSDMGTGLPAFFVSEPAKCLHGVGAVDIARQFHATATNGSWRKCRRTFVGTFPASK